MDNNRCLHDSARTGNIDGVKKALENGADVNVQAIKGPTALMLAVLNGNVECIECLVSHHANVNARMYNGWTALMLAARNGDIKGVQYLVSNDAEVNAKDGRGKTALMLAAENGHSECIQYLVSKNADVNAKARKGPTALIFAAKNGHVDCIKSLVVNNANVNAKDNHGWTALMLASRNGNTQCTQCLLSNEAEVNAKDGYGRTALMFAAENGHLDCLRSLVSKNADVNAKDEFGKIALMSAAENGHIKCIEYLVSEHADVNAQDSIGRTALMLAAENGQVECVKFLNNQSLLDSAELGNTDGVKRCLDNGAYVNAKCNDGSTALMLASENGHLECIKYLVSDDVHAEVNAKDNIGRTALMLAAENGHMDCVTYLVSENADLDAVNNSGSTALDLSRAKGYTEVAVFLEKMMAQTLVSGMRAMNLGCGHQSPLFSPVASIATTSATLFQQSTVASLCSSQEDDAGEKVGHGNLTDSSRDLDDSTSSVSSSTYSPSTTSILDSVEDSATEGSMDGLPNDDRSMDGRRASTLEALSVSDWVIHSDSLTEKEYITSGSFGSVYKAKWNSTGVALKEFKGVRHRGEKGSTRADTIDSHTESLEVSLPRDGLREIKLLVRLRHPNIVSFLGVTNDPFCVVMELMPRGSLFAALSTCRGRSRSDGGLPPHDASVLESWAHRLRIARDVAAGMAYLHARGIVHRDLKSPNVLLASDWTAKIADLGLSKLLEKKSDGHAGIANESTLGSIDKNPLWMAPEVVCQGKRETYSSDVWSFGVILWELLTGKFPWTHIQCPRGVLQFVAFCAMEKGEGLPVPSSPNETLGNVFEEPSYKEYVDLMQLCMSMDANLRPGFVEIAERLDKLVRMHPDTLLPSLSGSNRSMVSDSGLCRICCERPGKAAFLHCDASGRTTSHGGYCEKCTKVVHEEKRPCPTCRQRITGILHQHYV